MKSITTWFINISLLLVLTGMIGHEVIPHHHHQVAGEVKTCCESHHHEEEHQPVAVCNILANIHYKDNRPQIKEHISEDKHTHPETNNHACSTCSVLALKIIFNETPPYIPQGVFIDLYYHQSFSYRGPPIS